MARRSFAGKTVLITGAAGGLGAALCRRFAQAGARIGALDLREEDLARLMADLEGRGTRCRAAVCDLSQHHQVLTAVQQLEETLGPTAVLINNAAITHRTPFGPSQVEPVCRVLAVNFTGAVHCTAAVYEQVVAQKGLFIVISSVAGFAPLIDRSAYAASKHALHGFFNSLRLELRGTGVDVLVACPSFIRTGLRDDAPTVPGAKKPVPGAKKPWSIAGSEDSPEAVAEQIWQAATARHRQVAIGVIGRLSSWIYRFFPTVYERLMVRRMR